MVTLDKFAAVLCVPVVCDEVSNVEAALLIDTNSKDEPGALGAVLNVGVTVVVDAQVGVVA